MIHTLFVPGIPKATQTGSVIRVKGRAFPIRRNTAWSTVFGIYAREQAPPEPLEGAVACRVEFILPRPLKKRKHPCVRPDLDNLWKGLGDMLAPFWFHDDAQICKQETWKRYATDGEEPGVRVTVEEL